MRLPVSLGIVVIPSLLYSLVGCSTGSVATVSKPVPVATQAPTVLAAIAGQATVLPTAPAIATPTATTPTLLVANTGGLGVYIRRTLSPSDRIRAWPEGTNMVVVGADQQGEGRTWKNVKDPDGNVGWVPAEYLKGE